MSCFENQASALAGSQRIATDANGCGCNCENNGIVQILQRILNAQERAERNEEEEEFCDRITLGPCCKKQECNTRPLNIYTCDGTPVSIDFTLNGETLTTRVFRIEKIDGCICTFRCLAENPDPTCSEKFIKTETFFSVNEGCCCHIIKCLKDTFVDCL